MKLSYPVRRGRVGNGILDIIFMDSKPMAVISGRPECITATQTAKENLPENEIFSLQPR